MDKTAKPIQLSDHAQEQLRFRGTSQAEIEEAIRTSPWQTAEFGRLECRLTIPFHQEWNGRRYATKTVRPIFAEEQEAIIVVTVYVYYG